MMSHIYSFSAFSILLYISSLNPNTKRIIIIAILLALIFLLRNINIIMVPFFFIFNKTFNQYFLYIINPKKLVLFITIVLICIFPQLLYWKWAHGTWFFDSYAGYTFTNYKNPKFSEVLFVPGTNGHFLYNPIMVVLLIASFLKISSRKWEFTIPILLFIVLTWILASWFIPGLGCGFANRGFIELYAIFALVFAHIVKFIFRSQFKLKFILTIIVGLCAYINLKISMSYPGCYSSGKYDVSEYLSFLLNHKQNVDVIDIKNAKSELSSSDSIKTILNYSQYNYDIANFSWIKFDFDVQNFNYMDTLVIKRQITMNNVLVSTERFNIYLNEPSSMSNYIYPFPISKDYIKCNSLIEFTSKENIKYKINEIEFY
jgi:hypothetical protein